MALAKGERFGFLRPEVDTHVLGTGFIEDILRSCGIRVIVCPGEIRAALARPAESDKARQLAEWVRGEGISALSFSWRLEPEEDFRIFAELVDALKSAGLLGGGGAPASNAGGGGTLRALFFTGLSSSCDRVLERFPFVTGLFRGDESPAQSLDILGLSGLRLPKAMSAELRYDEDRLAFGREMVAKDAWRRLAPVDRSGYPRFGLRGDGVLARMAHGKRRGLPPLYCAEIGPWSTELGEIPALLEDWSKRLAKGGFLDVFSLENSWSNDRGFGGARAGSIGGPERPVESAEIFGRLWELSRPMLVRSSADTGDLAAMARLLEERLDIAWYALSFWWSSRPDGLGTLGVPETLANNYAALEYISSSGKPLEARVSENFAMLGCDDTSYVVSGWLAARAAKERGIRDLILPFNLSAPAFTWGVNELAKARALLQIARELEDGDFRIHIQPRCGSGCRARDAATAKARLAAAAALMDDIEPWDAHSPGIVQVGAWSGSDAAIGAGLAELGRSGPSELEDAIRLSRASLAEWRRLRADGLVDDMTRNAGVLRRTSELIAEARSTIASICAAIPEPFGPEGMYRILAGGFLAMPLLAERREEFQEAARWKTGLVDGAMKVVDGDGMVVPAEARMPLAVERARSGHLASSEGASATVLES